MAYYLFNVTKKAAEKDKSLRDQAAYLLKVGLWGIGPQAPNRKLLAPGDKVLAYVGTPEEAFVGHATLNSGVREFTPEEAELHSAGGGGGWPEGVAFSEADHGTTRFRFRPFGRRCRPRHLQWS